MKKRRGNAAERYSEHAAALLTAELFGKGTSVVELALTPQLTVHDHGKCHAKDLNQSDAQAKYANNHEVLLQPHFHFVVTTRVDVGDGG